MLLFDHIGVAFWSCCKSSKNLGRICPYCHIHILIHNRIAPNCVLSLKVKWLSVNTSSTRRTIIAVGGDFTLLLPENVQVLYSSVAGDRCVEWRDIHAENQGILLSKSDAVIVWRHNDIIKHGRPKNIDFQRNIGQNWYFPLEKFQILKFHLVFCL